jgi:type IV secretion system protein VirB1
MLPGLELLACTDMAVPMDVMRHVVHVESSFNPFAIGVVGGRLVRQPRSLDEALATVRMLEDKGYNFSIGLAQVNRYNLARYGLDSYEKAFGTCANLRAASKILAECYGRASGDWGKSFSCYYSGNFTTGFQHGYVQKVYASISRTVEAADRRTAAIDVVSNVGRKPVQRERSAREHDLLGHRIVSSEAPSQPGLARDGALVTSGSSRYEDLAGPQAQATIAAQPAVAGLADRKVVGSPPSLQPAPVTSAQDARTSEAPAVPIVSIHGQPVSAPAAQPPTQQAPAVPPKPGPDRAFVF